MEIVECIQGSPEWISARAGHPTASCFSEIITPKTMKASSSAEKYMYTLAGERITGVKAESFKSQWMERGTEMEDEARDLFQLIRGAEVRQVGLIYPDERHLYSCSPDGIFDDTGLEVKCPSMAVHVGYLLSGKLPTDYICQVQGTMLITGFSYYWFMSYYPGLPPLIIRVERDDKFCAALKVALEDFCGELDRVEKRLREMA